jgi:transposase
VLDAQRQTETPSYSRDKPQGVDQWGAQLPYGPLALGERRAQERRAILKLLEELRRTYRCHKQLHLATDNDSSHASKRVEKYLEDSGGRIRLHPLPSWSPESNPVELVWWSLHEAVSRNHQCAGLEDLVEFAEGYLKERQPFMLKLGEVYDQLERSPP